MICLKKIGINTQLTRTHSVLTFSGLMCPTDALTSIIGRWGIVALTRASLQTFAAGFATSSPISPLRPLAVDWRMTIMTTINQTEKQNNAKCWIMLVMKVTVPNSKSHCFGTRCFYLLSNQRHTYIQICRISSCQSRQPDACM